MIDRDRMLTELTAAMAVHHARRRLRHRLAGALAVVAATAVVTMIAVPREQSPAPRVEAVVKVLRNTPRTGLVRTIDDRELIDRLAEIDSPTGLIRTADRVWLTDPPL